VIDLAENLTRLRRIGLVKVRKITDESLYALGERFATLERLHLSFCDNLTVRAVCVLLNRVTQVTHLSLTSVSAFKSPALQHFCRKAPEVCSHDSLAYLEPR
jgi:F-box and leucine-rich repeat protein GRR1